MKHDDRTGTAQGYWKDPKKTSQVLTQDGWMKTGDLAVFDKEGFCSIVGRIKDVIIRYFPFFVPCIVFLLDPRYFVVFGDQWWRERLSA